MKPATQSNHIHHAACISIIHLERVIERGLREAKSCEPSDDIIDFFGCYTLMACLEQLKAQLPEKVTRVFIMASYQLAKELDCQVGTEDAEVIAGVLKHLA